MTELFWKCGEPPGRVVWARPRLEPARVTNYYAENLSGTHLHRVYALADDDVRAYLKAELDFCKARLHPRAAVLELGCGYGRVLRELAPHAESLCGIDNAPENLAFAGAYCRDHSNIQFELRDARELDLGDARFDHIICVQNGLAAFGIDPTTIIREAVSTLSSSGSIICTSYTPSFWPARLAWFRRQADAGLLGPLDEERTTPGVIACRDGFRSGTLGPRDFSKIAETLALKFQLTELPQGSLACEYWPRSPAA